MAQSDCRVEWGRAIGASSMSAVVNGAGKVVDFVDQRITASNWLKRNIRKAFPDHWSFLLGEIALFSFIVLLLSGTFWRSGSSRP